MYTKIAAMGFCVGAGMEFFMIHTGFYDKYVSRHTFSLDCIQSIRDVFIYSQ